MDFGGTVSPGSLCLEPPLCHPSRLPELCLFGLCFGVAGMNICVAQQSWG